MSPAIPFAVSDGFIPSQKTSLGQDMTNLDADMVELSMLLPRWQAMALQIAAKQRGLSAGHMLRRMIAAVVGADSPSAQASQNGL
jgi:hypothetical protein